MRSSDLHSRFAGSTRATVAVEFAFALPFLLFLLMLGVQIVTYVNAVRKTELLATSISEMISQATPPLGSNTATVNQLDLHFSYDAGLVVFPYLMGDAKRQAEAWWQDINIDYASVQFTPISGRTCPTGGDQSPCYTANVVWTSTGTTGGLQRTCSPSPGSTQNAQLPMNDTLPPNNQYLPRSVFGPGSIIVVDVAFNFNPVFAGKLLPKTMRIARAVYVQPRYASLISYDTTNNDGIATKCPGY